MSSEHPDELGNPAPGPGLPDHGSAPRLIPVRPRVRLGRWLHRGPQVHAGPQADAGPQVDATAGPVAVSHRAVDVGRLIGTVTRALLVAILIALGGLSAVIIVGFVGSGGSQPAQLAAALPSASLELMPMGNAHIPTTDACVLCHGAGGEIKTPPPILHPIEGWRRCLTCHTNETLGRLAPGHEGIAETECLNCHTTAQAGPAITFPHAALYEGHCLECHGSVAHLPSTMASTKETDCILCHKPTTLPPPSYPHAPNAILSCRACHQSAEVGALPIDHALYADSTCLLCHEISVVSANGTPGTVGPNTSPLPGGETSPGSSPLPSSETSPGSSAIPSPELTFPIVTPPG